jgi:hypothetical protein
LELYRGSVAADLFAELGILDLGIIIDGHEATLASPSAPARPASTKKLPRPGLVRYLIFDVADAGLERYQPSQVYQSIVSAAKYFPQCICARRWQQSDGLA